MTTYYLKYRPNTLEELDSETVREALKKIVAAGRIPHALLFAGPKGIGKTSAARILAKIINCEKKGVEPCNKCSQCLSITKGTNFDVIEMDAASNRGIDDVRALRDAVKLAPAKATKKVYIIDEAHMLTVEAGNALLKTLEEPPAHVVIILATTNPEKLIETIKSRTTIINFKKATDSEISRSLARVAEGEKIKIDNQALLEIARASGGSFRDATKILEQLVSEERNLEAPLVKDYLKQTKISNVEAFLRLLGSGKTKDALGDIEKIIEDGGRVENFIEALLTRLRSGLLVKAGLPGEDLPELSKERLISLIKLLTEALQKIKESPIEQLPLEIAVIEWGESGDRAQLSRPTHNSLPNEDVKTGPIRSHSPAKATLDSTSQDLAQTSESMARMQTPIPLKGKLEEINDDVWRNILAAIKPINTSIEALLRAARPVNYDGKVLTLGVFYRFHKERLEDTNHRKVLESVVAQIMGAAPIKVVCVLTEPPEKKIPEKTPEPILTEGKDRDILKIAEEIFGN